MITRDLRTLTHIYILLRVAVHSAVVLVSPIHKSEDHVSSITYTCLYVPVISFFAENLDYCMEPTEITHSQVSKFFDEFADTHYVANEMLNEHYPEDSEYTVKAVEELQERLESAQNDSDEADGS